jgi:hypothetical protein
MTRLLQVLLCLTTLIAAAVPDPTRTIFAQEPSQTADGVASEQVHDELRALRDGLLAAIKQRDKVAILKFLDAEVVLTLQDGEQLVSVRGQAQAADYLERLLTGPDAGVKELNVDLVVDDKTILHGDAAGIAYGSSNDSYVLRDGSKFTLKTRWTATVVKRDGEWKLASLQAGSSLFQNPVTDAYRSTLPKAAGISFLVGCLLCWILGRFFRRSTAVS